MEEQLANNSPGEIAATCMALQHMLISKGLCTFEELTDANRKAQEIVANMSKSIVESDGDIEKIKDSIREMVTFIGGPAAAAEVDETMRVAMQAAIDEMESQSTQGAD